MAANSTSDRMEMSRLQQEAIRRAREMQARAQIPPVYVPPQPSPQPQQPPPPAPPMEPDPPPQPPMEQMPLHPNEESRRPQSPLLSNLPIGGALDFLMKDPERTIILILLLILLEEKADTSLIFAMMYLLV